MNPPAKCKRCARVVPWFSFWGNLALAVYKLVVGVLGQSAALVADAVHSFTDVIGSAAILVATKVSAKQPDEDYPYGRGKAEFVGAIFVYTVLLFFSVMIMVGAIRAMLSDDMARPHFVTALGAVVSVAYNYVMFRFATCVGRRNNSPAILADAFENRADAISSVACIVGIVAAIFIHPICDRIAALVVGLIILYNCIEQLREAASGLMDGGLSPEFVEAMREAAAAQVGVRRVRFLRTRQTGVRFWVDIGVEVDDDLSVDRADAIAEAVRDQLKRNPKCHHADVYVLAPRTEPDLPRAGQQQRA